MEDRQARCLAFRESSAFETLRGDPGIRRVLGVLCAGPVALRALGLLLPDLPEPGLRRALAALEEAGLLQRVTMRSSPLNEAYLLSQQGELCRPVLRSIALSPAQPQNAPCRRRPGMVE
ncbi:MAG: winged helix-turn-helix transcriptional regulator [Deinococcus sp.]